MYGYAWVMHDAWMMDDGCDIRWSRRMGDRVGTSGSEGAEQKEGHGADGGEERGGEPEDEDGAGGEGSEEGEGVEGAVVARDADEEPHEGADLEGEEGEGDDCVESQQRPNRGKDESAAPVEEGRVEFWDEDDTDIGREAAGGDGAEVDDDREGVREPQGSIHAAPSIVGQGSLGVAQHLVHVVADQEPHPAPPARPHPPTHVVHHTRPHAKEAAAGTDAHTRTQEPSSSRGRSRGGRRGGGRERSARGRAQRQRQPREEG